MTEFDDTEKPAISSNGMLPEVKITEAWVSVEERLPTETGWYKVKTKHNFTSDAPLSRTLGGKLVWVVPDESLITHWREA